MNAKFEQIYGHGMDFARYIFSLIWHGAIEMRKYDVNK